MCPDRSRKALCRNVFSIILKKKIEEEKRKYFFHWNKERERSGTERKRIQSDKKSCVLNFIKTQTERM